MRATPRIPAGKVLDPRQTRFDLIIREAFLFFVFFKKSIVDMQYYVSFRCTALILRLFALQHDHNMSSNHQSLHTVKILRATCLCCALHPRALFVLYLEVCASYSSSLLFTHPYTYFLSETVTQPVD